MRTPSTKFIAIQHTGDAHYTWHERRCRVGDSPPMPDGCVETIYNATGKTISRDDGEIAEIYAVDRTPSCIVAELETAFVHGKDDRELLVLIRELRAAIDRQPNRNALVALAKKCPREYPAQSFELRDVAEIRDLSEALANDGFTHLAKAVFCGIAWSRRIAGGFDLEALEDDASTSGWSWNKPAGCVAVVPE